MLSREQLSTATAWGLDTAVSLKLKIPSNQRNAAELAAPAGDCCIPDNFGDSKIDK